MGVFHRTFSVVVHLTGKPVSVETPSRVGPRQWGQLPFAKALAERASAARVGANGRFI
jgi:hypothetical protein